MNVKRVMLVCVLAGMVLSVSCAPSIVTTDSGVYQHGKLYASSSKDMTAVHAAAVKAMEKFELKVIDEQKDVFYAKVTAKSADGKVVKVKIKPEGEKTSFNIGVSPFGNEARSLMIYEEMQKLLGVKTGK